MHFTQKSPFLCGNWHVLSIGKHAISFERNFQGSICLLRIIIFKDILTLISACDLEYWF